MSSDVHGRGEAIADADLERDRFLAAEVLSILAVEARLRRRGAGGVTWVGDGNRAEAEAGFRVRKNEFKGSRE